MFPRFVWASSSSSSLPTSRRQKSRRIPARVPRAPQRGALRVGAPGGEGVTARAGAAPGAGPLRGFPRFSPLRPLPHPEPPRRERPGSPHGASLLSQSPGLRADRPLGRLNGFFISRDGDLDRVTECSPCEPAPSHRSSQPGDRVPAGCRVPGGWSLLPSLCAQQVRMGRCLVPRLPALPVCLAVVQLLSPCSAVFAVVGPPEPILAMVGEDADLPCHLSPEMSAENMDLTWVRPSPRQVVHVYVHGQEETPAEEYRGRTSILREDVTAGKAALRIHNVRASDNGTYLCYFQDGDFFENAQVELQVAALGSDPHIDMKGYEAGGIRVNCTSAGWYPQPQIQWRDARGQSLSSEAASAAAEPQGLYAASASVILEAGSGEGVACVIRNPLLGQERSARLSISGPFFRNIQPWVVVLAVMVLVLGELLVGGACLLCQRRKRIQALSQEREREEAERGAAWAELQQEQKGSAQETLQDVLRRRKPRYRAPLDWVLNQDLCDGHLRSRTKSRRLVLSCPPAWSLLRGQPGRPGPPVDPGPGCQLGPSQRTAHATPAFQD
ncbi:butyrophilin subfamily 3 member A2-like isoform X2 [Phyllostomus hastatus]|uniref:butyrophilin subfamily 3 member A2-like isoform X2 n=1 Tax=Phyllostomus hastatus TaxID=9423 RepID=UPI001E6825A9|nr:butyrophilin subfamily 3 member A2-like isoform X2 [Phyllostomus hastatus]